MQRLRGNFGKRSTEVIKKLFFQEIQSECYQNSSSGGINVILLMTEL